MLAYISQVLVSPTLARSSSPPALPLAMAFSNYSNLFKSGLLTDDSSPARYRSEPWAKDYLGPRRGSAPGSVAESITSTPLPSASVAETTASIASGESFYFTFKKRRNPSMYRSFLSLDLAESQSLRSASLRAKESIDGMSSRAAASYLSATVYPSFTALYSPPLPSPPASPTSLHSVPDIERNQNPFGLTFSPSNRKTVFLHSPTPRRAVPSSSLASRRSVSPMRFASPPPSPPLVPSFDDPISPTAPSMTTTSSMVLSRASTVSSGYRRKQRVDALKRLEGRGADGAVGRLVPRMSQNFMSMSDDEDEIIEEDEDELSLHTDISVVIDQAMEATWDTTPGPSLPRKALQQSSASPSSATTSRPQPHSRAKGRDLSVTIENLQRYSATPRASGWGMFYGDDAGGAEAEDEEVAIEKGRPLDAPLPALHSMARTHSDGTNPRSSKRSRYSKSSSSSASIDSSYLQPVHPPSTKIHSLPPTSQSHTRPKATQNLHPLSHSSSISSLSIYSQSTHNSSAPSRSRSDARSRSTRTSVSELYVNNHDTSLRSTSSRSRTGSSRSRSPIPMPQLELRLDWLTPPNTAECPNFIDFRDETFETESRSDSWRSIFEVSCSA